MASREVLNSKFKEILGTDNVYYQPPSGTNIQYPCILYNKIGANIKYANDKKYSFRILYRVTYVDYVPDSEKSDAIWDLPLCEFVDFYRSDNLNHTVFNIYH